MQIKEQNKQKSVRTPPKFNSVSLRTKRFFVSTEAEEQLKTNKKSKLRLFFFFFFLEKRSGAKEGQRKLEKKREREFFFSCPASSCENRSPAERGERGANLSLTNSLFPCSARASHSLPLTLEGKVAVVVGGLGRLARAFCHSFFTLSFRLSPFFSVFSPSPFSLSLSFSIARA